MALEENNYNELAKKWLDEDKEESIREQSELI